MSISEIHGFISVGIRIHQQATISEDRESVSRGLYSYYRSTVGCAGRRRLLHSDHTGTFACHTVEPLVGLPTSSLALGTGSYRLPDGNDTFAFAHRAGHLAPGGLSTTLAKGAGDHRGPHLYAAGSAAETALLTGVPIRAGAATPRALH